MQAGMAIPLSSSPEALPRISIIIPLHNAVEYTRRCIAAIERAGLPADAELVLVDNASSDGTRALLDEVEDRYVVVRSATNANFAGGCALGVAAARGSVFVFLNNDTEVEPGWLEALVRPLADPTIGVTGARLLYGDGTLQHCGVGFGADAIGVHAHAGLPADDRGAQRSRGMQAVTAACMALRRDVWQAAGGFDPAYRNGLEDVDLCLKARALGFDVLYVPGCVVTHHESRTEGRFAHAAANIAIYLGRWQAVVVPDLATFEEDRLATMPLLAAGSDGQTDLVELNDGDDLAARTNHAVSEGQGATVCLLHATAPRPATTMDQWPAQLHHTDAVYVGPDGSWVRASRAVLERVGGLDPRFTHARPALADLVNRCKLHGSLLRCDDGTGVPGATPWVTWHQGASESERALLARRWGPAIASRRMPTTYIPWTSLPTSAGELDVPTRGVRMYVSAAAGPVSWIEATCRALFTSFGPEDDLTILVRANGDVLEALERAADAAPEPAQLVDVVIVDQDGSEDPQLVAHAHIVLLPDRSEWRDDSHAPASLAALARVAGVHAAEPGRAVELGRELLAAARQRGSYAA